MHKTRHIFYFYFLGVTLFTGSFLFESPTTNPSTLMNFTSVSGFLAFLVGRLVGLLYTDPISGSSLRFIDFIDTFRLRCDLIAH